MHSVENVTFNENASIRDVLKIIDSGAMKIALAIDENSRLLGTVTDGDIRRALLQGLELDAPVAPIVQRNPKVCGINESKEKILQKVLGKKIYHLPVIDEHGRLVGIEDIEELIKPEQKTNPVVIMAGGLGSRLRPLTKDIPKPMLHVGNRPILETIVENFKKYGFTDLLFSVNYKAEVLKAYFGNGDALGVNIEYIHEEKRLGTAGALSLMKERLVESFFVMNGDLLTNVNFEHLLDFHFSNNAAATMAVREYDFQVPYGVVNINETDIVSIEEKPIQKFFVNAGIYMLEPSVLSFIPENTYYDMPTLFEKLIEHGEKTVSFPIREYWLDIGRFEELDKARGEYYQVFK